jgi:hypothetical protein
MQSTIKAIHLDPVFSKLLAVMKVLPFPASVRSRHGVRQRRSAKLIATATSLLRGRGLERVPDLVGGLAAWEAAQLESVAGR